MFVSIANTASTFVPQGDKIPVGYKHGMRRRLCVVEGYPCLLGDYI